MQNKYNELVKIIKNNNIRLEKDEFKIVNKLIHMEKDNDEYYKKYTELSNKAKYVADAFRYADIDPNDMTKCYLVYTYELNYCKASHRKIQLAQNRSQLLHIFLNKTNTSHTRVKIMKYGLNEFVL